MTLPDAFYVPDGDGLHATGLTRGPWDPGFQHAGPPSALLARALAAASRLPRGRMGRFTAEILRPVPVGPMRVEARVLRPGRSVEMLEATLAGEDGEALMRATAWMLRHAPLGAAPEPEPGPAGPRDSAPVDLPWWRDDVAYHRGFEWRLASGSVERPGPACVWTRMNAALVRGEPATAVERLLAMSDAASGVSWSLAWEEYLFPNVDFSVHLEREPEGEWLAMDAVTRHGPDGAGQCTAVLSDARGRVGLSTQTLMVAAR